MKKVTILTKGILPDSITKDLKENESICPSCKGLGIIILHNPYGNDETIKTREPLPWSKDTLGYCSRCVFGVINHCKYCGKEVGVNSVWACTCEESRQEGLKIFKERDKKRYENARKITLEQAVKEGITILYNDDNGDFFDVDDESISGFEWLYATEKNSININVQSMIEYACEDLFEDVEESLEDVGELEEFVEKWCEKNKYGTTSYSPDYKTIVFIKGCET